MSRKKISTKLMGVVLSLALLSSLMVGIVPTFALTVPTVSLSDDTISASNTLTITFQVTDAITPGTITVTLPAGTTDVAALTVADVTVGSTSGIGELALTVAQATAVVGTDDDDDPTVVITPQGDIGAGATVQIVLGLAAGNEVTNPGAVGDYTLAVETSEEDTAVSSAAFALDAPVIPDVAGVVKGYNSDDVKLYEDTGTNAISGAIGTDGVVKVLVGPGTYDEDATLAIPEGVTVTSTDGAAVTIIDDADGLVGGGDVTLTSTDDDDPAVLDGFTVTGPITASGQVIIQNSVLSNEDGTVINFNDDGTNTTEDDPAQSIGNTITVTDTKNGLDVHVVGGFATSTDDTFDVTDDAATAITNTGALMVTNATITGHDGATGLSLVAGSDTTLADSTLSTLDFAINMLGAATLDATGNTIDACGADADGMAIMITAATEVTISDNVITNSLGDIAEVDANDDLVYINFNTLTGNVNSFDNDGAGELDASNNWWGVSTGPAVDSTNTKDEPFLRSILSDGALVAAADILDREEAAGVLIWDSNGAAVAIGSGTYDNNPASVAPPGIVTQYFDVYVNGAAAPVAPLTTEQVVINFFGIQSADALVLAWSAVQARWVEASDQMVDLFNGSVQVTVTPTTVPTVANLEALEFALVEPDPTDTGKPAQAGLGPAIGSVNVDTLPTFTWSQVADATGYEFVLAEEIGQTNSFAIINYAAGTTTNGHVARETLKYLTTYNWRVRAVGPNGNGAWQTSFFTTMDEPAPPPPPPPDPLPPVVITPTQPAPPAPEIILEVPASPAPVQVIPESVLWVVVGVGAILVIAVIVLIVRTRRVA